MSDIEKVKKASERYSVFYGEGNWFVCDGSPNVVVSVHDTKVDAWAIAIGLNVRAAYLAVLEDLAKPSEAMIEAMMDRYEDGIIRARIRGGYDRAISAKRAEILGNK